MLNGPTDSMMLTLLIEAAKGAVVGGLIGYLTNKLAVWMLFHPKKQIRLLGLGLPLTPGLVVKNQEKLADAIGRAVSRDLLDSETLRSHFSELDLEEPIRALVLEERRQLQASEATLAGLLGEEHAETLDALRGALVRDLAGRITGLADAFAAEADGFTDALKKYGGDALSRPVGEMLTEERRRAVRDAAIDWLRDFAAGETASESIHTLVSSALRNLPGSAGERSLRGLAREFLSPQLPRASHAIQEALTLYIESDDFAEFAQERVADRLYDIITERFSMAAMFINEKTIRDMLTQRWGTVVEELQAMIRQESLQATLVDKLDHAIEDILDRAVGSLANPATSEMASRAIADEIRNSFLSGIDSGAVGQAVDGWLEKMSDRSLASLLDGREAMVDDFAELIMGRVAEWMRGDAGRRWTEERIKVLLDGFLFDRPVSQVANVLPEQDWIAIGDFLGSVAQKRAIRILPDILSEHGDLAEVVSQKIREFDSDQIEATIVRVSGRELSGIVRLGGLIGVIVGAVMQVVYLFLGNGK